jgi:hypothetical protein
MTHKQFLEKEEARLVESVAEAQHTLDAFRTVRAYLSHRAGYKPPRAVEIKEPKLSEAPGPPTIAVRDYQAGFWDKVVRDAVEATADKKLWQAISRHTAFQITYENGPSHNL